MLICFFKNEYLQKYYTDFSLHDFSENKNEISTFYKRRSERQVNYIQSRLKDVHTALDIGCSVGYTLFLFKKLGVKVYGIEPSELCRDVAMKKYKIKINTGFFSSHSFKKRFFDLVIVSHLLEHLYSPLEFLSNVNNVCNNCSAVFIEIPDIDLFDKDDLFQFFFEHINYFNIASLGNLMRKAGFKLKSSITFKNGPEVAPFYPTKGSLWVKSNWNKKNKKHNIKSVYDENIKIINKYIKLVKKYKTLLAQRIDKIITNSKKIAIWGGGTFTAQLLNYSKLSSNNVKYIFDNNPKKDGTSIANIPILKPGTSIDFFKEKVDTIIIGSWSSQEEIYKQISYLKKYGISIFKLFKSASLQNQYEK